MIVYDSGQFFWGWDVQVIGMDVDSVALDKARRAVYHHNSFRGLSPAVKERHFVPVAGGAAQVKDPIRRLVAFRSGNIVEPASYAGLPPLDVIFCRNVLIYFSDAMILKVVSLFHDALVPGGYLFLGHAESLSRITDLFTPIRFQGAMVYRKEGRWPRGPARGRALIRVLVVDDSAFVRQALTRMLGSAPDIEVVGTAVDGKEGVGEGARPAAGRGDPRRQDAAHGRPGGPAAHHGATARPPSSSSPRRPRKGPRSRCAAWSWGRWTSSTRRACRAT